MRTDIEWYAGTRIEASLCLDVHAGASGALVYEDTYVALVYEDTYLHMCMQVPQAHLSMRTHM